jgi:Fanconi anemia group M protein
LNQARSFKLPSILNLDAFEIRDYQLELCKSALEANTLVVLPTGLGKTTIAALVVAARLEQKLDKKALVLAPTRPLVSQLAEQFKRVILFDKEDFAELTGSESPRERVAKWARARVLVCTPQVVRNDLIAERYSLANISVMIFDEAHRSVGNYPYVFIARRYQAQNPSGLTMGLTASPGSSPVTLQEISTNLSIKNISSKNSSDEDVRKYVQTTDYQPIFVNPPKEFAATMRYMELLFSKLLQPLVGKKLVAASGADRVNLKTLIELQQRLTKAASQSGWTPEMSEAVVHTAASIRLMHAMNLLETQGVTSARMYTKRIDEAYRKRPSRSLRLIAMDPFWVVAKSHLDNLINEGVEHPKLGILVQILSGYFKNRSDKAIIFTNYRDTASLVVRALSHVDGVRPIRFVGQAERGSDQGMSQKEQADALERFKAGEFNVLVATQVAEEGLDIDECNLVVMYENVPSVTRLVQRMGRTGRRSAGKVITLITKGTRDEVFYWIARRKQQNLKATISRLAQSSPLADKSEVQGQAHVSGLEVQGPDLQLSNHGSSATANPEIRPEVVVDSREGASSVAASLSNFGLKIRFEELPVGDYIVSDQVCVERKQVKDFAASIQDGRLFQQAVNIRRTFRRPVFIIEGESLFSVSLSPEAVRGALISLAVDYGIPILWSRTPSETALFISRMAIREQHEFGRSRPVVRDERKPVLDNDLREYVVASLPGIDSSRAKNLLMHFGSIGGVFNASTKELEAVEGIGEKTAARLVELINSPYERNNLGKEQSYS